MSRARYQQLVDGAQQEFVAGRLDRAIELFERAEHEARSHGLPDLADRAFCNRCAVFVELDSLGPHIPELQRVLLRTRDPKNRWMAAYYTALGYDLDDNREDAYRFAQRAQELAPEAGDAAGEAATANLFGNLALLRSEFTTAEDAYRRALDRYSGLEGYNRLMEAQVRDNLGYTLMCTQRSCEGIQLCEAATASMRELGAVHYLHQPLQDLCYGYLLEERLAEARERGEEALELAFAIDDTLVVKNLLFLLAQVASSSGDRFRARRYARELASWYPGLEPSEEMLDILLAADLALAVNLRG